MLSSSALSWHNAEGILRVPEWMTVGKRWELLFSQRCRRVQTGCPPRRNAAREQSDSGDRQHGTGVDAKIVSGRAVQQVANKARGGYREWNAHGV